MFAKLPRACRPVLVAALLFGPFAPTSGASSLLYGVTDLGAVAPVAINDAGQVAFNQTADGVTHAVLYDSYGQGAGLMTLVAQALPGGLNAGSDRAMALTAGGLVDVAAPGGWYYTDGKTYQAGAFVPIGDPFFSHGLTVLGGGVNSEGMLVGTNSLDHHAYLYDGKTLIDLNSIIGTGSNITLNVGFAINDAGQILAEGYSGSSSVEHAYLLTPTGMSTPGSPTPAPEPGSLAIFGLAAGAAWAWRRAAGRRPENRDSSRI